MNISNMSLKEIETRRLEIQSALDNKDITIEKIDKLEKEWDKIEERKSFLEQGAEQRQKTLDHITNGGGRVLASVNNGKIATKEEVRQMNKGQYKEYNENEDLEIRSLQKYLNKIDLTPEERSALTTSGASAVIPKNIFSELVTDTKYSDLLSRATVLNEQNRGETSIPISASTEATWKVEGAEETPENAELTAIKLYGHELMRLMSISSATDSLSTVEFRKLMLNLISEEVIETLEKSFITGTGVGQPEGLNTLDVADRTVSATDSITAKDVAEAISKLSNKHSRNAVIIANSTTLYNLSLMVAENDNSLATGADTFLKKEIVPNEHLEDNVVYVVDPKQLYVKFAQPLQVEADRSSGFRSATIDLRALAVVDAKFNPMAVAKVVVA